MIRDLPPSLLSALRRFGVAAALAALIYGACAHTLALALVREQAAQAARGLRLRAIEERQMLAEYLPRFERLRASGHLDDESRLRWTEAVQRVAAETHVALMTYQLAPAHALPSEHVFVPGIVAVSAMQLEMIVTHEGDLVRFFQTLKARTPGAVVVRRCRMKRAPDHSQAGRGLQISCAIDWLNARTSPLGESS